MADTETQNQLNAALRYAGASAGTMFGLLGAMSLITPEQAHDLVVQVQVLNQSILTAYGALTKMGLILGPVGVLVAGYFGIKNSSVKAMGLKLLSIATSGAKPGDTPAEAKAAIANASDAKQVLIAATIALPQVQTIVTDKETANAAPSESVVAADTVKVTPK